jgi:tetratricopeptide (TPR) repeat protein
MSETWQAAEAEAVRKFTAGDEPGAIQSLGRAISLNPDSVDLRLKRAVLLQGAGEFVLAVPDYEFVLKHKPGHAEVYTVLAQCYLALRRYDEMKAVLKGGQAVHPIYAYAGNVFTGADFDAAVADGQLKTAEYAKRLAGDFPSGEGLVFFAAANGAYFDKFGPRLAETLKAHNPDTHLHLHLFDPSEEQFTAARKLAATVTMETGALVSPGYYSNARFVAAREVHRRSRRPIFMVDVDGIVMGSLAGLDAVPGDVAVRYRKRNHLEQQFFAGGILVRPTPGGDLFFDTFAGYLAHCLFGVGAAFYLDQVALNLITARFADDKAPVVIADLPAPYCDCEGRPDAVVRQLKGEKK